MIASELSPNEYHSYYRTYIGLAGNNDLLECLGGGLTSFKAFMVDLPEDKLTYQYEKGKWTVAEVLVHLFDAERVFQYRALRFARKDQTALAGFDQDIYVPNSRANDRSLSSLVTEYTAIRNSTLSLFSNFNYEELQRSGVASDANMSVRALGFVIVGHQKHHQNILMERYGL